MRCHEAIDASILTDTAVPTSYTLTDYNERGWGWWYFPHIELCDEKVVLSADYLPAGTDVYTYLARQHRRDVPSHPTHGKRVLLP